MSTPKRDPRVDPKVGDVFETCERFVCSVVAIEDQKVKCQCYPTFDTHTKFFTKCHLDKFRQDVIDWDWRILHAANE